MQTKQFEQVTLISKYVEELKNKKKRIEEAEEEIKQLKAQVKDLEEMIIPDVMSELGINQVTLKTNEVITVKPFFYARLPEDPTKFFSWLRDNHFGGLIKEKVEVIPGVDVAALLLDFLNEYKISYEQMSTIHWKTLEAWFKECCEAGVKLPLDLFLNYTGRKATIKG